METFGEVGAVAPHSPAANAGLQAGDLVLAVDGAVVGEGGASATELWMRGSDYRSLKVRRFKPATALVPRPMSGMEPRLRGVVTRAP